MAPKKVLGEMLMEAGFLTQAQLDACLKIQETTDARLGDILVEKGYISNKLLMDILQNQFNVPIVDLGRMAIDPDVARLVPATLARKHTIVPVKLENNALFIAIEDPRNFLAIEDVRTATRRTIQPMLSARQGILTQIAKVYGNEHTERALQDFKTEVDFDEMVSDISEIGEDVSGAPIVRLVNAMIEQAVRDGASDIHVEPQEKDLRVRTRVDGQLFETLRSPKSAHNAIITRLKIMSNLNIAEKRIPQDGRFDIKVLGHDVDVRLSILPTVTGEKAVMRLLDRNKFLISKEKLGFTPANLRKFEDLLRSPHGIVLVTGPTGSGKSTTLYAMVNEINDVRDNIVTVEDPVEFTLPGLNQVHVNHKAGMTFAAGLRSILRQDPDIIMIGEIRDGETVENAVRAAITGHLVLSTIHTNDAVSTIFRLIDMEVADYLVAASLIGVLSQRLVKTICSQCKQPHTPTVIERELCGLDDIPNCPETFYSGNGCNVCSGTGYKGRMAVHEVLVMDSTIKEMIHDKCSLDAIRNYAISQGMTTLRHEAIAMAGRGLTTLEQVIEIAHGT